MKNTTSDASIVNNEETAHSPDRGSLELSRRNDQNVEDVILTIAMNDEQCLQIIPNDAARHHRCSCHGSKIQLIHLLTILSFLLFVIAAVIVEVYGKGKTKDALRRFLHIFRSVSMLTFLGQASFLVAVKFSFSNLLTVCCESYIQYQMNQIFGCQRFDLVGIDPLRKLSDIPELDITKFNAKTLCELLLYGNPHLNVIENRVILEATV